VLLCLDFFALRAGKAEQLLLLRDSGAFGVSRFALGAWRWALLACRRLFGCLFVWWVFSLFFFK
jgi:hypothetical protein